MTTNSNKKLPVPTHDLSKGDVWHSLVKGTIGAIPFAGSTFSELFHLAVASPAQNRQAKWEASLTEVLNHLIARVDGLSAESLSKNEDFLTTVLAASRIAMKTAQTE